MIIEAPTAAALMRQWDTARWPNFSPVEFASRDHGTIRIETDTLDRFQRLRTAFGRPLVMNSGYRTPAENARKSNTGLTGPHTTGRAGDAKCLDGGTRGHLVKLAIAVGFTGIGIGATFIHFDDVPPGTPHIPRFATHPLIWLY